MGQRPLPKRIRVPLFLHEVTSSGLSNEPSTLRDLPDPPRAGSWLGSFPGYVVRVGDGRGKFARRFTLRRGSREVGASPAEAAEGKKARQEGGPHCPNRLACDPVGRVDLQTNRHVGRKSRIHQAAGTKQIGIQIQTSGARFHPGLPNVPRLAAAITGEFLSQPIRI